MDEPLIRWPRPIYEYLEFIAAFLATGAVGFHFFPLRPLRALTAQDERSMVSRVDRRAAWIGLAGAVVSAVLIGRAILEAATRRQIPPVEFVSGNPVTAVQVAMALIAIVGFAIAPRAWGWRLAALGVVVGALRAAFFGQWPRVVNPTHMLAGGLWIGTLALIVFVGLPAVLSGPRAGDRRAALTAAMIGAFSPLALGAAATLAVFGTITAWRHLPTVSALWTTPYGNALIVKLCLVSIVVALGTWNWRRQTPRLSSEAGASAIQRSARAEVAVAALVLAVTAILTSLPDPPRP